MNDIAKLSCCLLLVAVLCGQKCFGGAPATTRSTVATAITAFENWWYKTQPFPSPADMEVLEGEVAKGSDNPAVLFWYARARLSRPSTDLTPEKRRYAEECAARAAEMDFGPAVVLAAVEYLKATSSTDAEGRKEALKRIASTLERREPDAVLVLGQLSRTGDHGLKRDLERSSELLEAAIKLGHVRAYKELALTYKLMGRFDDALKAARKGATHGDPEAQLRLGLWLQSGAVSQADPAEAELQLRKSAAGGYPLGELELAKLLLSDKTETNDAEAVKLITSSARYLDEAKFLLARAYLYGTLGQEIDFDKAEKLLVELGDSGYPPANHELGIGLITGLWLPVDVEDGLKRLEAAAGKGYADSQALLRLYKRVHSKKR